MASITEKGKLCFKINLGMLVATTICTELQTTYDPHQEFTKYGRASGNWGINFILGQFEVKCLKIHNDLNPNPYNLIKWKNIFTFFYKIPSLKELVCHSTWILLWCCFLIPAHFNNINTTCKTDKTRVYIPNQLFAVHIKISGSGEHRDTLVTVIILLREAS